MPSISKNKALQLSLLGIISIIVLEGVAGVITGSLALLSDAGHASFDALSTVILLIATSLSMRPADRDHTYGHGKIEPLGALIGGIILFLLAIGITGVALIRMNIGVHARPSLLGYAAASYTMAIEILRICLLSAALKSGSLTVKADLYHAATDLFSTSLVFVALGLTSIGYGAGDTLVSFVIAALIGYLSLRLVHNSMLDLSDSVSETLVRAAEREIRSTSGVLDCKSLRLRRVGDTTYVDAVCSVSPLAGITDADSIAGKIEVNLRKLFGKSEVTIHVEPHEWNLSTEMRVRRAAGKVEGAKGLHNVSITTVGDGLYVSLHVQVDPSLPLDRAHEIARSVEVGIEGSVPSVRQVTVHLEPSMPEATEGTLVRDKDLSETIRAVIAAYPDVIEISAIATYRAEGKLYINVHCLFSGRTQISAIHEMISKIEASVRQRIDNAVVTIHPEPVGR